jgi:polyhydroxyalkanoate synthesis regulator phasin
MDTVSGQERRGEVMTDYEYVTIREGARRYRVSDKKLQRAIRAEKLPARYPKPNRCEIAISDLERFLSGHSSGQRTEPLESRVAELEQRVADLEDLVQRLLKRQGGSRLRRTSLAKERTTGPLPKQFTSLLAFAQLHNVAEAKVLAHVDIELLPAKRGEWKDGDGSVVTLALDPAGKRAFHQIYHGVPPFVACEHCPH